MILRIVAVLALSAGALHAQDLPYSDTPTLSCLQEAETYTARLACAGASAQACIDTPEGGSTVGTGGCLDRERLFWDALLNEYYQAALSQAVAYDKDLDALDSATPRQAVALRAMQRSWIAFRDAACAYEASRWGGGTGAGPAAIGCAMQQTARQALSLQDWSR